MEISLTSFLLQICFLLCWSQPWLPDAPPVRSLSRPRARPLHLDSGESCCRLQNILFAHLAHIKKSKSCPGHTSSWATATVTASSDAFSDRQSEKQRRRWKPRCSYPPITQSFACIIFIKVLFVAYCVCVIIIGNKTLQHPLIVRLVRPPLWSKIVSLEWQFNLTIIFWIYNFKLDLSPLLVLWNRWKF